MLPLTGDDDAITSHFMPSHLTCYKVQTIYYAIVFIVNVHSGNWHTAAMGTNAGRACLQSLSARYRRGGGLEAAFSDSVE